MKMFCLTVFFYISIVSSYARDNLKQYVPSGATSMPIAQEMKYFSESQLRSWIQKNVAGIIEHYDEYGAKETIDLINNGAFSVGNIYPLLLEANIFGVILAHGLLDEEGSGYDGLSVGTANDSFMDINDVRIVIKILERTRREAGGFWVDYPWENPATDTVETRKIWVIVHHGRIFASGYSSPVSD
ncbi:MAG: hypothetical protein OXB84_07890 [Halobacteriovoraceae bacterium]|nr:hypothetical protein [Halobacteriovoraceae bacterium]